jgi:hypothetical protein
MSLLPGPFSRCSSPLKSRRALAFALLGLVLEALCVSGRAPGRVEPRTPSSDASFAMIERPKGRTGLELTGFRYRSP